ncbi:hypothetical protein NKG94_12090 [Micromonospora sp. M12]
MTVAPTLLAHGVGGRQDLPITLPQLVVAAALTLIVTFLALGLLWREPRLDRDATGGRPVPRRLAKLVDAPSFRWVLRGLGLLAAAWFCLGLLGPDTADNPTAGALYVLLWVGLAPLSLLLGPVWRMVNPLRTLHLLGTLVARRDPNRGLRELPDGVGMWPAAATLFGFVWLELVAPERATCRSSPPGSPRTRWSCLPGRCCSGRLVRQCRPVRGVQLPDRSARPARPGRGRRTRVAQPAGRDRRAATPPRPGRRGDRAARLDHVRQPVQRAGLVALQPGERPAPGRHRQRRAEPGHRRRRGGLPRRHRAAARIGRADAVDARGCPARSPTRSCRSRWGTWWRTTTRY